jgi:hypothetical protein
MNDLSAFGCTRARELIIDEVTSSDLPEGGAIGRLEHGMRVDIGAHPDCSRAVSDTQCSHDADAAETAAHLEPGLFQNRRHNFASPAPPRIQARDAREDPAATR